MSTPHDPRRPPTSGSTERPEREPVSPPPLPPPPVSSPPYGERVLRRSADDAVLGGVCGGLGKYLGIDPVLLRVAFAVLALGLGTGILLYIVAWIVIPEERPGDTVGAVPDATQMRRPRLIAGAVIIGAGVLLLLRQLVPWLDDRIILPLILIGIGALIAFGGTRRDR